MRTIEALIISCQEPQLERCLQSVRNQTVPFSNIVHIDNVVPESEAFNKGMKMIIGEWTMKVNGDFILYPNAVEMALGYISNDDASIYNFGLYDTFLKTPIACCNVQKSDLFEKVRYPNMLTNDSWSGRKLLRMGFKLRDLFLEGIVIGTHFEDPDEFQIFRRFYTRGTKSGVGIWKNQLTKLYNDTKDSKYEFAIKALKFGSEKRHYPTSHNIDFDREMFEKFRARI